MKSSIRTLVIGLLLVGLTSCARVTDKISLIDKIRLQGEEHYTSKTLRSSGFSPIETNNQRQSNQNWLLAQQNAKLAAYRDLAEQIYNEPLTGRSTVGNQVINDEAYRQYVDSYLREARPVDYRTVKDTLKTTLELQLTPRFYQCLSSDKEGVKRCLAEDHKLPITRLGLNQASTTSLNLACGTGDCSDQFHVKGFSNERNQLDNVLLNAGLTDAEWAAHTSGSLFLRSLLFEELINGF